MSNSSASPQQQTQPPGKHVEPFDAAATLGAPLVPKVGSKLLMVGGIAVALVGTLWLLLVQATGGYLPVVLPAMVLTGLGLGVFFVALPNTALSGIDPSDTGVASAMISTTQQIGGAIGPALLNTLYVSALTDFLNSHSGTVTRTVRLDGYAHGYRVAFIAIGLLVRTERATSHGAGSVPCGGHIRRTPRPATQASMT